MNLGENIYRLRTEKNMSQGDLADALEVSRQSVSKWENNSAVPELEKLVKMSELFGITIDELINGKHVSNPVTTPQPAPRPALNTRRIVGIILMCIGFASFLIYSAVYWVLGQPVTLHLPIVFSLLFFVCGLIFLLFKPASGYPILLGLYLFAWVFLNILCRNYGIVPLVLRIATAVCGVFLLWYTVLHLKPSKQRRKSIIIGLLILSLAGSVVQIAVSIYIISPIFA